MFLAKKNRVISRSIWVATILVLAIIWAFVIVFFEIYKADLIEGKRQELVQLNSVVAQHTAALFKAIETDQKVMELWLQTKRDKDPLTDPVFLELVARLEKNADGLIDIRLVTANGNAYAVPPLTMIPFANISDRDYYKQALAGDMDQVNLGNPLIARLTGKWIIPVSLRLSPEIPNFRLIITAIDLNRLLAVQENWRISRHGSIVLMRDDGTVLSRAPFDRHLLGLKLTHSRAYLERRTAPKGSYLTNSPSSDGVKRFVSYEYLDEFRLFVTVTRGYDEALEPFYKIRNYVFIGTAILTLILLAAALAIHRAQKALLQIQQNYQRQALVDDLTKVMNRRAFMSYAEQELSLMHQQGENLAVLMIDIDHFKLINDHFGHATGDEVLKSAATLWRGALRRQDSLGRLGGEEFSVILPSADLALARDVAERLRSLTEQTSIGPEKCFFSISIGVAVLDQSQDQIKDLLKKADQALYRAKQNGRNRVEVYTE